MAKVSRKGEPPTRIRRNVQQYGDPYASKMDHGDPAVCTGCHAVYHLKHWRFDEDLYRHSNQRSDVRRITCPACQKVADNYAEGTVVLSGDFLGAHHDEIMNLITNEEERAKGINPLERIVRVTDDGTGVTVTTTNEKLAQRIGRALQKAYQGAVTYRWSEDTKYAHVTWAR